MSSEWNKQQKPIKSKFFGGDGLIKQSTNSLYGMFIDAVSTIFNVNDISVMEKYKIPTVVVIGSESSGKSSLLENIIKCPVFPRSSKICTKQPIHLKLQCAKTTDEVSYSYEYKNKTYQTTKHKIIDEIQGLMNDLNNEISDEVITINICDEGLPHFQFIDLPGIRSYPPDLAKSTYELSEKYINMPDTLILCVTPSTTPRLTSYLPIALITKYNKMSNTIMALTMCDRVQEANIYDLIVDRVCGTSDEFTDMKFAGCNAIINRNSDSIGLMENNKRETEWFNTNVIEKIPKKFPHTKLLQDSIGTVVLVENIDKIYNQYIQEKWIPKTIEELHNDIEKLRTEIKEIGPEYITDSVKLKDVIFTDLIKNQNATLLSSRMIYHDPHNHFKDRLHWYEPVTVINSTDLLTNLFVNGFVENDLSVEIDEWCNKLTNMIRLLLMAICKSSKHEYLQSIKFERFSTPFIEQIEESMNTLMTNMILTLTTLIPVILNDVDVGKYIMIVINHWIKQIQIDTSLELLYENETSKNKRQNLLNEIEEKNEIIKKLQNIN